jgi:hypothetical protein
MDDEAKVPKFWSLREAVEYADAVCFFHKTRRQVMLRLARHFFQKSYGAHWNGYAAVEA